MSAEGPDQAQRANYSNAPDESSARRGPAAWGLAAMLGLVGLAINFLPLSINWGDALFFGGCVALVAVRTLPLAQGLFAVAIAAIPTFIHWGHPVAIALMCGEALVLSLLAQRGRPFVWSSTIYWIALGAPVAFVIAVYWGKDPQGGALLCAASLALNGIVNVAIAEILFILALRMGWPRSLTVGGVTSIQTMLSSMIVCCVALPALSAATIFSVQTARRTERELAHSLLDFGRDEGLLATAILERSRDNVAVLARSLALATTPVQLAGDPMQAAGFWEELLVLRSAASAEDPADAACWVTGLREILAGRDEALLTAYLPQTASCQGSVFLVVRLAGPHEGWFAVARVLPQTVAGFILDLAALRASRELVPWAGRIWDRDGRVVASVASRIAGTPSLTGGTISGSGTQLYLPAPHETSWRREGRDLIGRATSDLSAISGWRLEIAISAKPQREDMDRAQATILAMALALVSVVSFFGSSVAAAAMRRLDQLATSPADLARSVPVAEVDRLDAWIRHARNELQIERSAADTYRARLEAFEQMAPVITYVAEGSISRDFRVIAYSPSIQRVLGVAPEVAVAVGWWESRVHPDDLVRLGQERVLRGRPPESMRETYRLRGADGRYRWFLDTIVSLPGSDRSRVLHGLMLEVTDQKEAEHHLIQAAKLVQLGELAVSMGHELSQPLNVIKLAAANLIAANEAGLVPRDQLAIRLERIVRQVDKAVTLLGHLKVFGRRQTEAAAPFSVLQAIDDALLVLRGTLAAHEVTLEVSPGPGSPRAIGQAVLFEQVVLNLVSNAIDAIEQRRQREPGFAGRIAISVDGEGPMLRVQVADNGGGVPDEIASRLFEPFFTTKPPGKGTGLGLSIGARALEEMGGSLTFANATDGAVFTIALANA